MSLSDLVLSIADNKQMLGLRYAEWATRAPSLEADIAAAAMGLDDLGHSRVLYGCLEPLGEDPRGPERESDPASLRALPYFDEPWTEWAQFVAANAILDTAFTVMIEACVNGSVVPLPPWTQLAQVRHQRRTAAGGLAGGNRVVRPARRRHRPAP